MEVRPIRTEKKENLAVSVGRVSSGFAKNAIANQTKRAQQPPIAYHRFSGKWRLHS